MFKFLALIATIFTLQTAKAESLHPCTPIVEAQDSHLHCRIPTGSASITIKTLMSRPIEMCSGENHYEYHTAVIEFYDRAGNSVRTETIFHGDFTYKLDSQRGFFRSESRGYDFDECVSPLNGGFSIGN
jgi:hypothetical protein